jgi:hypothetical protein
MPAVVTQCLRRGLPIPPPYDNPPTIGREFALFKRAFDELNTEREPPKHRGGKVFVQYIKPAAIRDWAVLNGLYGDGEFMEELRAYIPALDSVWVEVEVKRLARKN